MNEEHESATDVVEQVSAAILYLWKWKSLCEPRWCTIGVACRALVVSLCVGLEDVVAKAMADPASTNYQLNGFNRLSKEVRTCICVAGIAAFPAARASGR